MFMACHEHLYIFVIYSYMKICWHVLPLDWAICELTINIYLNTFYIILKYLQLLERVTYGCKITTPSGYIEELIRYLVTNM